MRRKFVGPKELTPEQRFLNAIYGRGKRRGCGEVSLKHVLSDTSMSMLRRSLRPALSLDYQYNDAPHEPAYNTLVDIIDPESIVAVIPTTTQDEINRRDVLNLTERVHKKIAVDWRKKYKYGRDGTKLALKVFDGLCDDEPLSTMARRLRTARQRVSQIRDQLVTLKVVKQMRKELRSMKSE